MRFKTLTKANLAEQAKLNAARDAVRARIFAADPTQQLSFNECYRLFRPGCDVRAAYSAADTALTMWESRMVGEGRGWFDAAACFAFKAY